jgi:hypothetical protein
VVGDVRIVVCSQPEERIQNGTGIILGGGSSPRPEKTSPNPTQTTRCHPSLLTPSSHVRPSPLRCNRCNTLIAPVYSYGMRPGDHRRLPLPRGMVDDRAARRPSVAIRTPQPELRVSDF